MRINWLRRMTAQLLCILLLASLAGSLAIQEDDDISSDQEYTASEEEDTTPEECKRNSRTGTLGATTGIIPNLSGTLGATTGIISDDDGTPRRDNNVSVLKGSALFSEFNNGAHYYVFSSQSSTYQEAFANIKLPTTFNNASNTRNGCIALGIYGTHAGIDMGLKNEGNGWFPAIFDVYKNIVDSNQPAEICYPQYTAPSTATNAIITVNPVSTTSVRMYIQFKDSSGNNVGTTFEETVSVQSGNLVEDAYGHIICRFYRFASLIPKAGVTDNREDGSKMLGGQFTNVGLYHRTNHVYQDWGIYTNQASYAWIVYPDKCSVYATTTSDSFTINHNSEA